MNSNPLTAAKRSTNFHLLIAAFLVIGAVGSGVLGGYLSGHPIKPLVQTITVEKPVPVPCPTPPPTKSGPATTRGTYSPAVTGSGNPITYGAQPANPAPKSAH
jgi:hypothetical protein